jgi:TrmH family RNA methyltransferase
MMLNIPRPEMCVSRGKARVNSRGAVQFSGKETMGSIRAFVRSVADWRGPLRYDQNISTDRKDNLRVVLVATRNPLNIGASARAMANFGFSRLRVVNPYDVAFREARSAVGAAPLLQAAEDYSSVAAAVADCRLVVGTTSVGHRELQHPLRRLEYGARLIGRALAQAPVALLFGSEKFGLTNDDLSHCHWLMRIPTEPADLSMNLGQAVALCLYELARDPKASIARPPRSIARAAAGETEQVTLLLLEILRKSGYTNPVTEESTEEKVRRLVRRLEIAGRDAPVLLGMLRQILWKIG